MGSVVIPAHVRAAYAPFLPRLKEFYSQGAGKLAEIDLFQEVERRFGEEMAQTVCVELGVSAGACVVTAIELMKEAA